MESRQYYMRVALRIARTGAGSHSGRPLAGAVVVAGGKPVGYGYPAETISDPAVLTALEHAGPLARGATVFTNIEPCLDSNEPEQYISRLLELRPACFVIGHRSPAPPDASARVLASLESAGARIEAGVCEDQCLEVNEVYYKYSRTRLPFVTVKFAASLDGRLATSTGESQWISGPGSLGFAHQLRREHDAILVGIGTVLKDDPQLTVRLVKGKSPVRVVVDSSLRIPETARLLLNGDAAPVIIATTDRADLSRKPVLEKLGAEVLVLPPAPLAPGDDSSDSVRSIAGAGSGKTFGVDLKCLLYALGDRRLASVLVEGGSALITSLLANGRVDRLVVAIAPKILGKGIEAIGDLGITRLRDAITFSSTKVRRLGGDIIFDGRLGPVDSSG